MKNKKNRGVEAMKERYGWICVSFWVVGLLIFFVFPILQSIIYMFSDVKLVTGGFETKFVFIDNIKNIFTVDPNFTDNLKDSFIRFLYTFPSVMVLSFILATLLNQKFKGRIFFRALYFLPVIVASGVVYKTILTGQGIDSAQVDDSVRSVMFNVSDLIMSIGLPDSVSKIIEIILDRIMDIVWHSGIQIVLFVAGMQSVPPVLYEASKVEGANKWEEFWMITVPMMTKTMLLVSIFTMVEIVTSTDDAVMTQAYTFMSAQNYGESSAMLWVYFALVAVVMSAICGLYYKLFAKKWI